MSILLGTEGRMRLRLALDKNWETVADKAGPSAFMRKGRSNNNAFQLSFSENTEEKKIEPPIDLRALVQTLVVRLGGQQSQILTGGFGYGQFASAIFAANEFPYCQVWCITNGVHVITATFICDAPPIGIELEEVERMVMSLSLSPASTAAAANTGRRWQFWRRN